MMVLNYLLRSIELSFILGLKKVLILSLNFKLIGHLVGIVELLNFLLLRKFLMILFLLKVKKSILGKDISIPNIAMVEVFLLKM